MPRPAPGSSCSSRPLDPHVCGGPPQSASFSNAIPTRIFACWSFGNRSSPRIGVRRAAAPSHASPTAAPASSGTRNIGLRRKSLAVPRPPQNPLPPAVSIMAFSGTRPFFSPPAPPGRAPRPPPFGTARCIKSCPVSNPRSALSPHERLRFADSPAHHRFHCPFQRHPRPEIGHRAEFVLWPVQISYMFPVGSVRRREAANVLATTLGELYLPVSVGGLHRRNRASRFRRASWLGPNASAKRQRLPCS
jgi:hypothetical protein